MKSAIIEAVNLIVMKTGYGKTQLVEPNILNLELSQLRFLTDLNSLTDSTHAHCHTSRDGGDDSTHCTRRLKKESCSLRAE